jgi:hypothetical protein
VFGAISPEMARAKGRQDIVAADAERGRASWTQSGTLRPGERPNPSPPFTSLLRSKPAVSGVLKTLELAMGLQEKILDRPAALFLL